MTDELNRMVAEVAESALKLSCWGEGFASARNEICAPQVIVEAIGHLYDYEILLKEKQEALRAHGKEV